MKRGQINICKNKYAKQKGANERGSACLYTSKPSEVASTSMSTPTTVSAATIKSIVTNKFGNQRELFFSSLQATGACYNNASLEQSFPIELPYPLPSVPQRSFDNESSQRDPVSEPLIGVRFVGMRSVAVGAEGNCLSRTASYISNGTETLHVEMRVKIVHELIAHAFLSRGMATEEARNVSLRYAQYSPWYGMCREGP